MTKDHSAETHSSRSALPSGGVLLIEPFSGISGDMFLGALLDLGVSFERVEAGLRHLSLSGYRLKGSKVDRAGIQATKFDVILEDSHPPDVDQSRPNHGHDTGHHHDHPHSHSLGDGGHAAGADHRSGHVHRRYRDIRQMVESCGLEDRVRKRALKAFQLLAEAEGHVHGRKPDEVEFHEVGAVDSIVDIVGAMIALEELNPVRICSTPVNVGRGTLKCQHGIYPVPAPATEELLRGVPTFSNEIEGELTTPTGAAILRAVVDSFGPRPSLLIDGAGYGAGTRNPRGSANILRVSRGSEPAASMTGLIEDDVVVIESAIDDMNPEIFGHVQEMLLDAGALDCYLIALQMKKGRPGTLVTVLCEPEAADRMAGLLLAETTTLGVRLSRTRRAVLPRDSATVDTVYGPVRVKRAHLPGGSVRCAPEYEDCRRLAREKGVSLVEVFASASAAAQSASVGRAPR